jgi:hypothetical protein
MLFFSLIFLHSLISFCLDLQLPGGGEVNVSNESALDEWYKEKCGANSSRKVDDYPLLDPAFVYAPEIGFSVCVDGGHGFDGTCSPVC